MQRYSRGFGLRNPAFPGKLWGEGIVGGSRMNLIQPNRWPAFALIPIVFHEHQCAAHRQPRPDLRRGGGGPRSAPCARSGSRGAARTPANVQAMFKPTFKVAPTPPMVFYVKDSPDACGRGCDTWTAAEGQIDCGAAPRSGKFWAKVRDRKLPIYTSPGWARRWDCWLWRAGQIRGFARSHPRGDRPPGSGSITALQTVAAREGAAR